MKFIFSLSVVFCLLSTSLFSQVSFDDGNTFYTDSSQTTLCNGKFRTFYPGFKQKTSTNYVEGRLHGEFIEYYADGKVKAKFTYVNGQVDGEALEFYPETGIVKSRFNYSNGLKNGECVFYDEKGDITERKVFVKGVIQQ